VGSCDEGQAATSGNVELVVSCAIALHRAGDTRAPALCTRLEGMTPRSAIVQWHAATGDLTRAFELIATLRAANHLPANLAFDPLFAPLRKDERYAKLLR
jgi:hypothetical protein